MRVLFNLTITKCVVLLEGWVRSILYLKLIKKKKNCTVSMCCLHWPIFNSERASNKWILGGWNLFSLFCSIVLNSFIFVILRVVCFMGKKQKKKTTVFCFFFYVSLFILMTTTLNLKMFERWRDFMIPIIFKSIH